MCYNHEDNSTRYLSFILCAVAAVVETAKRFNRHKTVYPQLLYERLVEIFSNTQQDNSNLFLSLDDYTEEWSRSEGRSGEIILYTELDNITPYTIGIDIDGFSRLLEWDQRQFARLDTLVIKAVLRCVSERVIDIMDAVEVDTKLYLMEMLDDGVVKFSGQTSTSRWEIKISVKGVDVHIVQQNEPTENTFIPWNRVIEWLE